MTKRIIKLSLKTMVLSIMALIFCGAISLAAVRPAAADDVDPSTGEGIAPSTLWDKAQQGGLDTVGRAFGGGGSPLDIRIIVASIINVILGFLGIIAVVLIFYAGFKWMTAGGNEDSIATAKKIMTAGAIGLVIILSAFGVATFVLPAVLNATGVK